MDISTTKMCLDTSILAKSIMNRRKYIFIFYVFVRCMYFTVDNALGQRLPLCCVAKRQRGTNPKSGPTANLPSLLISQRKSQRKPERKQSKANVQDVVNRSHSHIAHSPPGIIIDLPCPVVHLLLLLRTLFKPRGGRGFPDGRKIPPAPPPRPFFSPRNQPKLKQIPKGGRQVRACASAARI
jgi:hypothetical protein